MAPTTQPDKPLLRKMSMNVGHVGSAPNQRDGVCVCIHVLMDRSLATGPASTPSRPALYIGLGVDTVLAAIEREVADEELAVLLDVETWVVEPVPVLLVLSGP